MSERVMSIKVQRCKDLSGVDGDGLGEGEVAFEGEELWWEEDCRAQEKSLEAVEQGTGINTVLTRGGVCSHEDGKRHEQVLPQRKRAVGERLG